MMKLMLSNSKATQRRQERVRIYVFEINKYLGFNSECFRPVQKEAFPAMPYSLPVTSY